MESKKPDPVPQRPVPSKADILSGAKVLADAARSRNEKTDKARVAGAAADLLGAASHYGKLDEKGVGKMVNKAEDYLRNYNTSHPPAGAHSSPPANQDGKPGDPHSSPPAKHDDGKYGDYIKMAEGLLKKKPDQGGVNPSSAPHPDGGGGGFGDVFKKAEGLLKKH